MAELNLDCPFCGTPNSVPVDPNADTFTCSGCGEDAPIDEAATIDTATLPDYLVGEVVSDCRIIEKVGEGGFGSVYKAIDQNLQRTVAVKVMLQSLSTNIEFVQKFIREAVTAAQLNHPNIVAIHKVGRDERRGLHYLIMEFVEGRTLSQIVDQQGVLKAEEVVPIALQACDALATAHEASIVHRDIKPENLMLDGASVVKITDFGLAKSLAASTNTTKVMGTPHYMSPEQFEGKPVDGRSDIYSLGVTIYFLLSKERPYEGQNTVQIIYSILTQEPKALTDVNADVPPQMWTIIQKMIAKKAEDRYQSLRETIDDLRRFQVRTVGDRAQCTECGAKNAKGRKFCRGCGAALLARCPACGADEPAQAQSCSHCGADLAKLLKIKKALQSAKRFQALGDLRRAADSYRLVLEADPEHGEARGELSQLDETLDEVERVKTEASDLLKTGEIDEALKRVEELLARHPTSMEVREHRDQLRQQAAERKVNAILETSAKAQEDGDIRRALELLDGALRIDPNRADVRAQRQEIGRRVAAVTESRQKAVEALAAGRYEDAFTLASEVLQITPGDTAMEDVRSKAQSSVASVDSMVSAGREKLDAKEYAEALTKFEAALAVRPGDPQLFGLVEDTRRRITEHRERLSLCRRLMADREYEEAIRGLERILEEVPLDAEATSLMRACKTASAAAARRLELHAGLDDAQALEDAGDFTGALERLKHVVQLDATQDEARRRMVTLESRARQVRDIRELANEHLHDGRFEDAVAALERLVRAMPAKRAEIETEIDTARDREQQVRGSLRRAEVALERKEYRRSKEAVQAVLDIAPRHPRASAIKKDAEKAVAAIDRFLGEADRLILSEMFDEAMDSLDRAKERGAAGEEYASRRLSCEQGRLALLKTDATRSLVSKDYEAAIAAYDQVLEVSRDDADALKGKRSAMRRIRILTTEPLSLRLGTAAAVLLLLGLVHMTAIASTKTVEVAAIDVENTAREEGTKVRTVDTGQLEPEFDDAMAAEAGGDFATALAAYEREMTVAEGKFKDRRELITGREFARAVLAALKKDAPKERLDALGAAEAHLGNAPELRATRRAALDEVLRATVDDWFREVDALEAANDPGGALDLIVEIEQHPAVPDDSPALAQVKSRGDYLEAMANGNSVFAAAAPDFTVAAREFKFARESVEGDELRRSRATARLATMRAAWMTELRRRAVAAGDDEAEYFEVIRGLRALSDALEVPRATVLEEFRK